MLFQHEMEEKKKLSESPEKSEGSLNKSLCVFVHQSVFDSDGDGFVFAIAFFQLSSLNLFFKKKQKKTWEDTDIGTITTD